MAFSDALSARGSRPAGRADPRSRVAQPEQQAAGQERRGGPGSEHAEAAPGTDRQTAETGGGLDGEPSAHGRGPLDAAMPVRASHGGGDDRGEVEQAEDGPDGRPGVPDDRGDARSEEHTSE